MAAVFARLLRATARHGRRAGIDPGHHVASAADGQGVMGRVVERRVEVVLLAVVACDSVVYVAPLFCILPSPLRYDYYNNW